MAAIHDLMQCGVSLVTKYLEEWQKGEMTIDVKEYDNTLILNDCLWDNRLWSEWCRFFSNFVDVQVFHSFSYFAFQWHRHCQHRCHWKLDIYNYLTNSISQGKLLLSYWYHRKLLYTFIFMATYHVFQLLNVSMNAFVNYSTTKQTFYEYSSFKTIKINTK